MDSLELSALLSSRLCHDLVGPIGAVNNGLEILDEESDAEMRRRAIDLMVHSAGEAARRLKFYRLAFGMARSNGVSIGLDEAREAAQGLFEASKIALDWPDASAARDLPIDLMATKLLLNMIVVGSEALTRGGTLSVGVKGEQDRLRLLVVAAGPGASLSEETRLLLVEGHEAPNLSSRSIQPFLAARLAEVLETRIGARAPRVGRVEIEALVGASGAR